MLSSCGSSSTPAVATVTPTVPALFFKFAQDHNDVVRAVIYINEGNGCIQLNDEIIKLWKAETKQSFWLRGGLDLFGKLGFAE